MPATEINVTEPSGGQNWQKGTTHTIVWEASVGFGYTIDHFSITLWNGGAQDSIIDNFVLPLERDYTWTLATNLGSDTDYRVQVKMHYHSGGGQ